MRYRDIFYQYREAAALAKELEDLIYGVLAESSEVATRASNRQALSDLVEKIPDSWKAPADDDAARGA